MSALSSSAVTIGDGAITITADLLAPKLGLSVEALKAEMRRDYIYSVIKQGMDETRERASPSAIAFIPGLWWSSPTAGWSRPRRQPTRCHQHVTIE
jgi:hypothetical protein